MALLDAALLGADVTFQSRVQASLVAAGIAIAAEGNVASHTPRLQLVHTILASAANLASYTDLFAASVGTDASVISDATAAGTIPLTGANVVARAALVTDAHINAAVSGQFNAFCQGIPA